MARNTVYNYFPSKDALLQAYVNREVARFMPRVTTAVDAAVGARRRLAIIVEEQLRYFADNGTAHHDLAGFLGPDSQAALATHFEPLERLIGRILREGVHEGDLRPLDVEHATALVTAVLAALRTPLASGRISREAATDLALDFILNGLSARSAGTAAPDGAG